MVEAMLALVSGLTMGTVAMVVLVEGPLQAASMQVRVVKVGELR
jgi:hypothetical protein